MRLLSVLYLLGVLGVLFLYFFLKINFIWALGYLLILLLADLVPKKFSIQTAVSIVLLAGILLTYAANKEISVVLSAFLMLISGLPGILLYAAVYLANGEIKSQLVSEALASVSFLALALLIVLHVAKAFFDRVVKVTWFILGFDLIPIVIDIALTLAMSYLVFTHVQAIYPFIQGLINSVPGIS